MKRRMTAQKKIVYDALEELGHADVEEIIAYILHQHKQISLASIYRNIHALLSEDKIKTIQLENHSVLETVKPDHIHFVCECCGKIYDIPASQESILKKFKDCVHQINKCDIALYGTCQECTRKGKVNEDEVCM